MSTPAHGPGLAPRTVLFDALGTLVTLLPPTGPLRATMAARFGIELSEDEAAAGLAAEIAYYRRHLDEGHDEGALATLRSRCAEVLRRSLPRSPRLDWLDTVELRDALLSSLRFRAFADAAPVLRELRARDVRTVVISNWDCSLHDVLGRLSLASQLDGVITSAEAGARKPAAEIFSAALAIAGAVPSEAIHVGDSLDEDVAGARRTGITPILLDREGSSAVPGVLTIRSLHDLQAVVYP